MKQSAFTLLLVHLGIICGMTQNTESLFTLPASTQIIETDVDWIGYVTYYYNGEREACGQTFHTYVEASSTTIYLDIVGQKVFLGRSCNSLELTYDFSLEQGDTITIQDEFLTVVERKIVKYLDDRERIYLRLSGSKEREWVEGIGDLNLGLMSPQFSISPVLQCVTDDGGSIYLAQASEEVCENFTCNNLSANFILEGEDNSITPIPRRTYGNSYFWNFGDGNTSEEINPEHSYQDNGCYIVSLTITRNDCAETETVARPYNYCVDSLWTKTSEELFSSFDFASDSRGMMVQRSVVNRTDDGGITWQSVLQTDGRYLEVYMNSIDEALVLEHTDFGRVIHLTDDGGLNWQSDTTTVGYRIARYKEDRIYLHDDESSQVRYSADKGANWEEYSTTELDFIEDVQMVDENFFVGVNAARKYYRSFDQGASWEILELDSIIPRTNLAIHFLDRETGFIGTRNSICKTTDGGLTWREIDLPLKSLIRDIEFSDALNGWAVGNNNIWRTINGGESWELEYCQNKNYMLNIVLTENEIYTYLLAKALIKRSPDPHFSCTTSTEELQLEELHLSPNPASETISFYSELEGVGSIYDVSGRLIAEKKIISGYEEIEVVSYLSGMYFLVLRSSDGQLSFGRFVKI